MEYCLKVYGSKDALVWHKATPEEIKVVATDHQMQWRNHSAFDQSDLTQQEIIYATNTKESIIVRCPPTS